MSPLSDNGPETLPPDALRRLVVDLPQRLGALEAQVAELGDQFEKAETAHAALQAENQDLRDENALLKNMPPRSPFKPSGLNKVTEREVRRRGSSPRQRGPKRDKDRVPSKDVLSVDVPSGSRFKRYETVLVRGLATSAELIRYRRKRWLSQCAKDRLQDHSDEQFRARAAAPAIKPDLRQLPRPI